MKRFLMCILALLFLWPAAFAEDEIIYDPSEYLSDAETAQLSSLAESLSKAYGADLLVTITDEPLPASDDLTTQMYIAVRGTPPTGEYGILAIDLYERYYSFNSEGHLGYLMHAYGDSRVENLLYGHLSENDFSGAVSAWLQLIGHLYSESYSAPAAYQPANAFEYANQYALFILIAAILIALIAVSIMIAKLKTAKFQSAANDYLVRDSLHLHTANEFFLYETVAVRRIETNNNHHSHSRPTGSSRGGGRF